MAVWDMDGYRHASPDKGRAPGHAGRTFHRAAVAASLLLFAGLSVWGYRVVMRQMHGLPVIHAEPGPARVAPENPGGELAQHQGLAVNMIAADGVAEKTADLLVLAPKSGDLSDDDGASDQLQITEGSSLGVPKLDLPAPRTVGKVLPGVTAEAMRPAAGHLNEPVPESLSTPALDDESLSADVEMTTASGAAITAQDIISPDVPGLSRSPFPPKRPEALSDDAGDDPMAEAAAAAVAQAMAEAPAPVDLDPESLTRGTQLAQIGSYESEEQARLEWDKAVAGFGPLMQGKQRVIQAAESGGRTFYRLRVAGFESRDDARRFCAAFRSGGQCVPAQVH